MRVPDVLKRWLGIEGDAGIPDPVREQVEREMEQARRNREMLAARVTMLADQAETVSRGRMRGDGEHYPY